MSQEGELKKRLDSFADRLYKDFGVRINKDRITEILDAAAKEYPCLQLPHKPEQYVADVFIKLTLERDEWFKKWFGSQ